MPRYGMSTDRYQEIALGVESAWPSAEMQVAIGGSDDTSTLKFPHPRLSLTHSEAWAIAVGTASGKLLGIGVDLEVKSAPKPETARRFLSCACT